MSKEIKWILALAVVAAFFAGAFVVNQYFGDEGAEGAPGGRLIEQYIPVVRYNDGIKSALGIHTESTLQADGAVDFNSTLDISGVVDFTSTLGVDGETTASLFTSGGATTSSTTAASMTLAATDVCDNSLLEITPTVGNITMTFPTAALLIADCVPNIGDQRKFWMFNASSTASTITIADGADCIHVEGEGLTTVIDNDEWGEITFMNLDGARCMLDVEIRQDAD